MSSLPHVPTPVSQRWREFRIQVLPWLTFTISLLSVVLMWRHFVMPAIVSPGSQMTRDTLTSKEHGALAAVKSDHGVNVSWHHAEK